MVTFYFILLLFRICAIIVLYASIQDVFNMCAKWYPAEFRDYGKVHHKRWNKCANVFTCSDIQTRVYLWRKRTS